MSIQGLTNIRSALATLSPKQVREASERPVHIHLHARDADAYHRMEAFLLQNLQGSRRAESAMLISRGDNAPTTPAPAHVDAIHLYDTDPVSSAGALVFDPYMPDVVVARTLKQHADAGLALARYFQPFRKPFVQQVINSTCRENTIFSITTALPDIIPSFIELPWAVAEFASDSAFLTMNQVRMAFQLAGASDREVGYLEQKSEIAVVIGSAFGWRALARQIVGKIPFGGGLVGKAAIAYAGTKVLGLSLDRYYSTGYQYSRDERKLMYNDAFEQGKKIAQKIFVNLRPELQARAQAAAAKPAPTGPTS